MNRTLSRGSLLDEVSELLGGVVTVLVLQLKGSPSLLGDNVHRAVWDLLDKTMAEKAAETVSNILRALVNFRRDFFRLVASTIGHVAEYVEVRGQCELQISALDVWGNHFIVSLLQQRDVTAIGYSPMIKMFATNIHSSSSRNKTLTWLLDRRIVAPRKAATNPEPAGPTPAVGAYLQAMSSNTPAGRKTLGTFSGGKEEATNSLDPATSSADKLVGLCIRVERPNATLEGRITRVKDIPGKARRITMIVPTESGGKRATWARPENERDTITFIDESEVEV